MANIKVSEMPETTAANIDDLIMIIQGGGNKKITEKNLLGDSIVVSPTEPVGNNRRKVWFRKGKNLFNKNVPIITGYYLDNKGSLVPNEGSWYQNVFIEVNSKTQYTISSTVAILRICFYDKDRKFISRVATENTSITFSTPENCKYVRLSGQNADTQVQSLQLEQGSKATSYEAYIEPQIFIKNSNDVYEEFIKKPEEVYSTDEQKTNKIWIDGKPIYRKTIVDTTFRTDFYPIANNIEQFVNQYGYVKRKDYPNAGQFINSRAGTDMSIQFLASNIDAGIQIDWGSNWKENYSTLFDKIIITVEYTKK